MRLYILVVLATLVTMLPVGAARAQVQAPSLGGEVNQGRITATTIQLTFGTTGTGQGRVVGVAIAPGGMPVLLAAIDGTFYKGSAIYGQGMSLGKGYAVYSGTGHSVTVTGLRPNTSYYITNAEYNTDSTSIMYNNRSSSTVLTTSAAPPTLAPLPVELVSFTGTVDSKGLATLRWETASEHNSDYFAVERSADGTTFAEAGRLAAAGSSTQGIAYQWPDPHPLTGLAYYRLRQVDLDGTVHYSTAVPLAPPLHLAQRLEIYPVPSAGQAVQLLLQGYENIPLTLRLTDALGRSVLAQTLLPPAAQYSLPLLIPGSLAEGTYFLTLAGGEAPVLKRIVVSY